MILLDLRAVRLANPKASPFQHQATWNIIPRDTDGVDNGRSYDDSSWLRMDTTVPHSGRRSGRFALPAGAPTFVNLPCQRGDEHFTKQAKGDKLCHGGMVNAR